ncbi:MAG: sugar nucleotide-binding protein [Actinobacteria bacterium]|nr:sugar nucleotide-binding protein [Actinomycetota bacterium]
MRIVVTGGGGNLGREVMAALGRAGHEAVSASRRSGVDLRTGVGLAEVLRGADAVVHTADTLRPWEFRAVTLGGTRRLGEAVAAMERPAHLVYISIVGVDHHPYAYYRMKYAAEMALRDLPIPVTVLRATQFHSLAAALAGMRIGPLSLGVRGMQIQPVDIAFVGQRLAELATSPAPTGFTRATDLAGPDRFAAREIAELVARHTGKSVPRRVDVPAVGGTMRAFAEGVVLPGPEADLGGERFVEWLDHQPRILLRR